MKLEREWVEPMIFGGARSLRFTQDSPVLPDVWIGYAEGLAEPSDPLSQKPLELLLTPYRDVRAGELSKELKERLARERGSERWRQAHADNPGAALIAYNKSTVVANLWFDELVRVVLPLSHWWDLYVRRAIESNGGDRDGKDKSELARLLEVLAAESRLGELFEGSEEVRIQLDVSVELLWMIRIVGSLQAAREEMPPPAGWSQEERKAKWEDIQASPRRIVEAFANLLQGMGPVDKSKFLLWSVSRNRAANASGSDSVSTIKADAAKLLFRISSQSLTWAVIDSGIDATHPSFRQRQQDQPDTPLYLEPFVLDRAESHDETPVWANQTRVKATFDFTLIRYLLSGEVPDEEVIPEHLQERVRELRRRMTRDDDRTTELRRSLERGRELDWGLLQPFLEVPHQGAPHQGTLSASADTGDGKHNRPPDDTPSAPKTPDGEGEGSPAPALLPAAGTTSLVEEDPSRGGNRTALSGGKAPQTGALLRSSGLASAPDMEPLREVPEAEAFSCYVIPQHEHGTHVAGILAGDWRASDNAVGEWFCGNRPGRRKPLTPPREEMTGVCPDLNLYDLRVLDDAGNGDEFSVMAALQFVRYLNSHKDTMVVHGVNLSLSINHDVANYACGRTPVCEECERLVGAGIVVVAAAGNEGYLQYMTAKGLREGYRSISITDPGNADAVITVGATHRTQPHTYGVSYFSSRGPTGDGRIKPDLVAPGEKIDGPTPCGQIKRMDGTSMAAPHVSGAAALLIARHRELMGHPIRIKEILMETATDLGRERYFQGSGVIDVLRALQSV